MKIKKVTANFTIVSNNIINDKRLSWKAKGVFSYLYSKPDDWDFSSARMKEDSSDGRDLLLSALKELETAGYLKRHKLPSGKVEYSLDFEPKPENPIQAKKPDPENPYVGKSLRGKSRPISNTEDTSNTERESKTEQLAALEESFRLFWEAYPNKIAKPVCLKWWLKKKPSGEALAAIMAGLASWKKVPQWTKDKGSFIPHPYTWLNQERWESTGVGEKLSESRKTVHV